MALELYMVGLITQDMEQSLTFYRRLGLALPEGSDGKTHVGVKMESGVTLFLDSKPSAWETTPIATETSAPSQEATNCRVVLEFFLTSRAEVEAKYTELKDAGYQSYRAPFETPFGMLFAMINDPDGNTILLSAE